ncbi:MAG: hypothetical protein H6553_12600 [Chitinophagales bacterium]|nr:hypothetical protein [Chitinophagales bacterium]
MIVEVAILIVKAEQISQFEQDFAIAKQYISSIKGYIKHSLLKCIEQENKYILLAGNNDFQELNNDWKFHGQVLCFYDDSDTIAGKNYDYWKNKPNYTTKFEQIKIDKNLGHGFLYQPYKEWIEPSKKWILYQEL